MGPVVNARSFGKRPKNMDSHNRPRDVIDELEAICEKRGHVAMVDESDYRAFVDLTQPQVERLAIVVMLEHEKEVRRLAAGHTDEAAVERVAKLTRNAIKTISVGLIRVDSLGCLGFYARNGPEPSVEMQKAMVEKYDLIEPMLTNTVRRTLPWLLSREVSQGELPL